MGHTSEDEKRHRKKLKKRAKKSLKRSSPSSSTSSKSSRHKHKKRKKSKKKKSRTDERLAEATVVGPPVDLADSSSIEPLPLPENGNDPGSLLVPRLTLETPSENIEEASVKLKGPMTKEQWERQRSNIRRVYDPQSQRTRLIRGNGEIVEEIVSRDRHLEINKTATRGDGAYYETVLGLKKHL